MNTQEKVKILKTPYPQPNQLLMVLAIILASLAIGLVPIIYGIGGNQSPQDTLPSEAALWSVLGEKER